MDVKVETPAAPAAEPSIDEIVTAALAEAEKAGTPVVTDEEKPAETAPAAAAPKTETPPVAEEPKGDEITAARARQILAKAEERIAQLDAREQEITAREAAGVRNMLAELLKAPKSFLAKHGAHIDDLIDASVAEGKVEAPEPQDEADRRLTAIEQRLKDREAEELAAQNQKLIDDKIAAIHRDVKANPRFSAINEGDRAGLVTDFMLDYHREHGKPIAWDKAAAMVEADLRGLVEKIAPKLGFTKAEAAKPAAAAPAERPGTTSIGGSQNDAASKDDELPEDPNVLMDFLVKRATNGLLKSA